MPPQPLDRLIEHRLALAEGEARKVPRRIGRIVERGDRHRRDPGVLSDMATERRVVTVEAERTEIGR